MNIRYCWKLRLLVPLWASLLASGCAPPPAGPPKDPLAVRFQSTWDDARPWAELGRRLRLAYARPDGDQGELLVAAMLWPEKAELHPELPALPAVAKDMKPGPAQEAARFMAAWRSSELCSTNWALDLVPQAVEGGTWVVRLPLPANRHQWLALPVGTSGVVGQAADRAVLNFHPQLPGAMPATVRVVVALDPVARPTQLYRHGDEITVATWGVGFHLLALEARDVDGRPLQYWFASPN